MKDYKIKKVGLPLSLFRISCSPAACGFMIALFSLFLGTVCRGEELAINQIDNPGFEYKTVSDGGYGERPLYWSRAYSTGLDACGVTNDAKHGEQCLFISDTSSSAAAGLHSDPIPVTAGYCYTLRGWGKRDSTSSASMYLRFYSSNNTLLSYKHIGIGLANQWTAGSVTATAPEGAEYARVLLYSASSATGTCFFDSVSLTLADEHVGDGGFTSVTSAAPPNWTAYNGYGSFEVVNDSGNNILRITDNSSTLSTGARYYCPASPGTPYRLAANLRKSSGSGYAKLYLTFYDADNAVLGHYSTGSSSGSFVACSIEQVAPSNTVYARILCYSPSTDSGTCDFDDVSFTRNYDTVKYVAPAAVGNGSGDSAANAEAYTSSTLWNAVDSAAASEPVRVVFLTGDYTNNWSITGLGNASNNILIEGETPYAVNYCGTDGNYFIYIAESRNLTFRHFNFTAEEEPADLNKATYAEQVATYDYLGIIELAGIASGDPTCDIRFEGVSFVHLLLMAYDAIYPHDTNCHDISWERCSWVTMGYDLYDHCLYSTEGASNLNFESCFFQDCAGPYVRYRSGATGGVQNSTFISTGNQPTGDTQDRVHWSFIQVCAFVSASHPDEKLGTEFVFKNNSFTYEQTQLAGFPMPYQVYVSGPAPSSEPTFHLVPVADGAVIADTTESTATRNTYFEYYFGIDPSTAFDVSGNTYSGCWDLRFGMNIVPTPSTYWSAPPSQTESANVDLDKLVGID